MHSIGAQWLDTIINGHYFDADSRTDCVIVEWRSKVINVEIC